MNLYFYNRQRSRALYFELTVISSLEKPIKRRKINSNSFGKFFRKKNDIPDCKNIWRIKNQIEKIPVFCSLVSPSDILLHVLPLIFGGDNHLILKRKKNFFFFFWPKNGILIYLMRRKKKKNGISKKITSSVFLFIFYY